MALTGLNDKFIDAVRNNLILLFFIVPLGALCFLFVNLNLLNVGFYSNINIAFDLDQAWFFDIISYSSHEWQYKSASDTSPLLIKHPFLYVYRIPSEVLQLVGFTPEVSVITISLIFHIGTIIVSYFIFVNILECSLKASLITLFMMMSSTFLVNGIVLDTYVLAGFWIACIFLLYLHDLSSPMIEASWLKTFVYVMAVGTTMYLLFLVVIVEISLLFSKRRIVSINQVSRYLVIGVLKFTSLFFAIFIACYYQSFLDILSNPTDVIKRTLWAVVRPGEKEGVISILGTFLIHTFIAPYHNVVEIEPERYMVDYRGAGFRLSAYLGILVLVISYVSSLKNSHPLLFTSIVWLLVTMVFHVEYQDRGSLFLYTGHTLLAASIIVALGLKNLNMKKGWILVILTVLTLAYNNFQSVFSAITSVHIS